MGSNEVQILRYSTQVDFSDIFTLLFIFVPTFYFYSLHFKKNIGTFYSLHFRKLARYFSFVRKVVYQELLYVNDQEWLWVHVGK